MGVHMGIIIFTSLRNAPAPSNFADSMSDAGTFLSAESHSIIDAPSVHRLSDINVTRAVFAEVKNVPAGSPTDVSS